MKRHFTLWNAIDYDAMDIYQFGISKSIHFTFWIACLCVFEFFFGGTFLLINVLMNDLNKIFEMQ